MGYPLFAVRLAAHISNRFINGQKEIALVEVETKSTKAMPACSSIDSEAEEVGGEMEVVAGLIQKLVDKNVTRKLDQHDYRKKYDGYASRYAALEAGWTTWILCLENSFVGIPNLQ